MIRQEVFITTSFILQTLSVSVQGKVHPQPLHCRHDALLPSPSVSCSAILTGDIVYSNDHSWRSILVDASNPFFPWSYEPVCTRVLPSLSSRLCVYTNASFANGRGISIFTTPRIAEEFTAMPPFQNSAVMDGLNSQKGQWHTKQLQGKGIGMMASKTLERGTVITAHTPVLLVHRDLELSMQYREIFLRTAINQLPPATRKAYLDLSIVIGDQSLLVQDILKANTFEIQISEQVHLALLPETSRINHDCGPNSQYYFDPDMLTHYVHAVKTISPDEEVTISYTDPFQGHKDRHEHLRGSFYFTCSCARCSSAKESDATLTKILSIQQSLSDWEPTSTASIQDAEKLIQLFRDDHLDAFLDTAYGHAVFTYNAVGDIKRAVQYAKLAAEATVMTNGPHAPDFNLWKEIIVHPETHWSWRWRNP